MDQNPLLGIVTCTVCTCTVYISIFIFIIFLTQLRSLLPCVKKFVFPYPYFRLDRWVRGSRPLFVLNHPSIFPFETHHREKRDFASSGAAAGVACEDGVCGVGRGGLQLNWSPRYMYVYISWWILTWTVPTEMYMYCSVWCTDLFESLGWVSLESNSDLVNCMLLHNLCSRRCLLVLILCYCNLHDFDSRLWCSNWRHSVQLGGGVLILEPGTHLEDGM